MRAKLREKKTKPYLKSADLVLQRALCKGIISGFQMDAKGSKNHKKMPEERNGENLRQTQRKE